MLYNMCRKCRRPVKYPAAHCSSCVDQYAQEQIENKRVSGKLYSRTRDKKYIRFYNSADWKRLSAAFLQDKVYKCEGLNCNKVATEVHHMKPIQTHEGWLLRLEWSNLKAVCVSCHNKER